MSTFKERLVLEYVELKVKGEKLNEFIYSENFSKIDPLQQSLLKVQIKAMETYLECLIERIDNIK